MAEKMTGGKMGGSSKSSGDGPIRPHIFRIDRVAKQRREEKWQEAREEVLKAEGARIWRRPSSQR